MTPTGMNERRSRTHWYPRDAGPNWSEADEHWVEVGVDRGRFRSTLQFEEARKPRSSPWNQSSAGRLTSLLAAGLPGSDVQSVPQLYGSDVEHESAELRFAEVRGSPTRFAEPRALRTRRGEAPSRGEESRVRRRLSDPLVDPDVDAVARLLANRLSQRRLDREPVRAVTLGHQRADERLAVDRTTDLHEPAGAEELRHVGHHHARPRAWVVALLKLGFELAQHGSRDSRTKRIAERAALVALAFARRGEDPDAVDEESHGAETSFDAVDRSPWMPPASPGRFRLPAAFSAAHRDRAIRPQLSPRQPHCRELAADHIWQLGQLEVHRADVAQATTVGYGSAHGAAPAHRRSEG